MIAANGTDTGWPIELIERICTSRDVDDFLCDTLARLREFFGAEAACGFELAHDGQKPCVGKAAATDMPKGVLVSYNDRFVQLDPICGSLFTPTGSHRLRAGTARAVRLSDDIDCANNAHLIYCNDFLRREELDHVLGILLRSSIAEQPLFVLGFQRSRSQGDFSNAELACAEALLPYLLARLEYFVLQSLVSRLQSQARECPKTKRSYRVAVYPPGRALIASLDGIVMWQEPQPVDAKIFFPSLAASLRKLANTRARVGEVGGILNALGITGAAENHVVAVHEEHRSARRQLFRLSITPPDLQDPIADWARRYRLTERERDVVSELAKGLRNAKIADNLGLSVRTVENHLRAVFSKAGVASRAEVLSNMVGSTDAPAPVSCRMS